MSAFPSLDELEGLLDRCPGVRVAVVGDVFLDEYLTGSADRISPEAPVPVVRVQGREEVLGGAGNVLRNLAALGARAELFCVVGEDAAGQGVRDRVAALGGSARGVRTDPARPTSRKTRLVAGQQQIVRFDHESEAEIEGRLAAELAATAVDMRADALIFADYGKGACSQSVVEEVMAGCREAGVPVFVDPKFALDRYRGAALIKPNAREVASLSGGPGPGEPASIGALDRAVKGLSERVPGSAWAVTLGGAGMRLYPEGGAGEALDAPGVAREVFDLQGAGDTAIAVLALACAAGGSLMEAACLANSAAAQVVSKRGTATASPEEVRELLPAVLTGGPG